MTNYVNFKLSKDVEKNPGLTQYNTDHHELTIRLFMENHSSLISSENLMQSRLGEIFHVNKQLFLQRFVDVIKKLRVFFEYWAFYKLNQHKFEIEYFM